MKNNAFLAGSFAYILRRLLVLGLCASFVLCLLVVGIITNVLSDVLMHLPTIMQLYIRHNVVIVLSAPPVVLILFCSALYYITRDIISGPARYLDERQQLLRDKAYHSAYRIIILACVIIGAGLILHATLFHSDATMGVGLQPNLITATQSTQFPQMIRFFPNGSLLQTKTTASLKGFVMNTASARVGLGYDNTLVINSWSNNVPFNSSIVIWSYATLLVSLLLLISILPRSVLAWKKRM